MCALKLNFVNACSPQTRSVLGDLKRNVIRIGPVIYEDDLVGAVEHSPINVRASTGEAKCCFETRCNDIYLSTKATQNLLT
jgi:hypothetical protein